MKVWVYLNGMQQGPYTLEQLRVLPIDATTPVWHEGLAEWTPAGVAPETAVLFDGSLQAPVPEAPAQQAAPAQQPAMAAQAAPGTEAARPATHLVWCILLVVLGMSPFGIAGIFTSAAVTSRYNRGDLAGARRSSEATEWLIMLGIVWMCISLPVLMAIQA